jgi:hypothetical protein
MLRRDLLGALSMSAVGLASAVGRSAGAEHEDHHDNLYESCLKNCQACKRACDETFHQCTEALAQGKREYAKALHLVADCSEFCDLSATVMGRRSSLMVAACAACAKACQDCGAECDQFDIPALKDCARACHDCEASCRAMVKATGGHHG